MGNRHYTVRTGLFRQLAAEQDQPVGVVAVRRMFASAVGGIGGEGWIRTSVRLRGQIYSLLPLTTRPPLHEVQAGAPNGGAGAVCQRAKNVQRAAPCAARATPCNLRSHAIQP